MSGMIPFRYQHNLSRYRTRRRSHFARVRYFLSHCFYCYFCIHANENLDDVFVLLSVENSLKRRAGNESSRGLVMRSRSSPSGLDRHVARHNNPSLSRRTGVVVFANSALCNSIRNQSTIIRPLHVLQASNGLLAQALHVGRERREGMSIL